MIMVVIKIIVNGSETDSGVPHVAGDMPQSQIVLSEGTVTFSIRNNGGTDAGEVTTLGTASYDSSLPALQPVIWFDGYGNNNNWKYTRNLSEFEVRLLDSATGLPVSLEAPGCSLTFAIKSRKE